MAELDPGAVDALVARARQDIDEGLLPACQLALALDGEVVVHEALGAAGLDARFCIFSATKPFVTSVVWQLLGEGALRPDQPVHELLPAFGTNGKEVVTLDHLLLHTAGFPWAPVRPAVWLDRDARQEVYGRWRLSWPAGSRFEYHPMSAHWVLADLIHAVTGADHRDALRARVLEPLGLRSFQLGVPDDEQGDVLDLELTGEPADPASLQAVLGLTAADATVGDDALMSLNHPRARRAGVPGGGAVSDAADVTAFYQALLHDDGALWSPSVLADATGVVRNTFPDPLLRVPINRTRGLVLAGDDGHADLRGMGRSVSPRAFGHNGAASQVAWADPATGLSFCYLTSGRDRDLVREHRRVTALSDLAAACVVDQREKRGSPAP